MGERVYETIKHLYTNNHQKERTENEKGVRGRRGIFSVTKKRKDEKKVEIEKRRYENGYDIYIIGTTGVEFSIM